MAHQVCTGAEVEMITAGGEEGFVSRMILEILELRERCQCVPSFSLPKYGLTLHILTRRWYTSMLGKQSSLTTLVSLLRVHSVRTGGALF